MRRWVSRLFLLLLLLPAGALGEGEWARAVSPRVWSFPRDHGAHPEYRTEWWYFTGNLSDRAGHRFGYQLTFFRQGLRLAAAQGENPWSVRDLYLAHFALSDVAAGRFRFAERASRAGPGLAGAAIGDMDVRLLGWRATRVGGRFELRARAPDAEIELTLEPRKPPVLHGEQGLSRKGPREGQASHYASLTHLETRGRLRAAPGGAWAEVTGTSWFDQEFGSNQLSQDQVGWDWFSIHLSDGRDLMAYFLRRADGALEPASSGTLVEADGSYRPLPLGQLRVEVTQRWTSPQTRTRYPSQWRLRVASARIDLLLSPWLADQELVTAASTGVTYWEGAVGGTGVSDRKQVACEGYVELTGYGGRLGGVF